MYGIKKTSYFHTGTFHAPKSPMIIEKFTTKDQAEKWLSNNNLTEFKPNHYSLDGTYYLAHGEYSRPTYNIVGCR